MELTKDTLIDFLLHLNERGLINNYDFSYEDVVDDFLTEYLNYPHLKDLRLTVFNKETGEVTFKPKITPESLFLQIFDGCVVKFDHGKYPDSVLYLDKNGNYLGEYKSTTNYFWLNYELVWKVFALTYSLNLTATGELLDELVEKYFKLKGVTTSRKLIHRPDEKQN
jgi:hypothetical protein